MVEFFGNLLILYYGIGALISLLIIVTIIVLVFEDKIRGGK